MPFKQLSSLKKLTNLGERVVALAPLESDRLVAAITTDPVKVCVQPLTGSHRVTNASLDEANDLALLNKNVAVVKAGDDLWALLDIQHRPKMDQVGRDIRSLHFCPTGATALAIGWDGNGAALAFQNNEVGGRQFVLRGDVRAASLTGDRTFVVVDNQLREHAGSTPESGAVARVDLPAEAKSFDRLAGGHALSALTKRGAESVCVVVREGATLVPKLVPVAGGVVDVAVIETSLFVVSSDGKLRLFNAEGIAAAAPTAELSLRAEGEPTSLAATTRGGAKLWIGTRGGDFIRCDAVKGSLDV